MGKFLAGKVFALVTYIGLIFLCETLKERAGDVDGSLELIIIL